MAIFLPTKIKGDIVIYSKWCIQCEHPTELLAINIYALHNDLDVQILRTVYRPADHKRATELWGCRDGVAKQDAENYSTFVLYKDKIYTLKEFVEMIGENSTVSNKMVTEGKTKDDVQRLPKAKRAARKNRMAGKARKAKATNKEKSA